MQVYTSAQSRSRRMAAPRGLGGGNAEAARGAAAGGPLARVSGAPLIRSGAARRAQTENAPLQIAPQRQPGAQVALDLMVTPPTASWDPIPGRLFQPPARRPVRRCVGCTSKHHRISGWASKRRVGQPKKKTRGQPPQRPKTNCPTLQRAALPRPAPQRAPAGASRRRRETKARARGSQSNCRHNRPWGSVANWVALHSRRKPPQARASNTA